MPKINFRVVLVPFALLAASLAHAQSADNLKVVETRESYILTLTLNITDKGRVTTNQIYTLTALAANANGSREFSTGSVRDGDKVPVTTGGEGDKTQIQYIDTGTNIDVDSVQKIGSMLVMHVQIENSTAISNPTSKEDPIIRQTKYKISPILTIGKLSTIYSSTDAVDGHKVEILLLAKPLETK